LQLDDNLDYLVFSGYDGEAKASPYMVTQSNASII